jgi:NAD(P)-dependent dehydrogenase (short-subunit alcohol dehydrogenase family)
MPVYFITGAARGIGLELARQLSDLPSSTVIAAVRRTSSELSDLQHDRSNIHIVNCDVSSEASVATLSTTIPETLPSRKIDFLINNAGVVDSPETRGLTVTAAALNTNIGINVLGPAFIVSILAPLLAPNALVVNVSSGIGSLGLVADGTISAGIAAYSISKAALNMLTIHQADALKGVARVACLDPGHVKTRLGGEKAVVEIADSARGIRKVINELKEGELEKSDRESGRARFFNFRGEEVPW